jgi:hypothetical protein
VAAFGMLNPLLAAFQLGEVAAYPIEALKLLAWLYHLNITARRCRLG